MTTMETYVEAFLWRLENRMEGEELEICKVSEAQIVTWLTMADNEIQELKAENKKLRGIK